ncbi:bifunctional phosphoribosylaminoimidazolecarboxamide formyltransferase/IMP cyclohydrolase [Feifania hominis]|uniref:Bifunctional purine biosynthesis protein PurH n=1 Tax=Feifania hominis TaxID=2763660 RepID=A0A926DF99_9FIRM|nr:bifunctional phosphoribosylaminoimidazolecarboxamide formyltransferase/IMP cyclohydrolase [Feifania hominis]MBC8536787.1 bifunctional phosphoribosylaminoimidazolecarboxamide formyltransferase/IMP cyclohydrolase [Feifania hominis]
MKKRALLSVSDKTGIVEFARELHGLGFELVSTGGTKRVLRDAGIPVLGVSELTGFPECLDGRVKTLHPVIHAGILARRDHPEHMAQIAKLGISTIDMVVINLYPFKATILKDDVTFEEAIENIDIGGPTMIRAAAKNWQDVTVIVDPRDYDGVLAEMKLGKISLETKARLARKVFAHTANYDAMISNWLGRQAGDDPLPETITMTYEKVQDMRYGENPHQRGAFYREVGKGFEGTIAAAKQLHGKELSYNNINDANGALDTLKEFDGVCAVGVKHANPCGVGLGKTLHEAYVNMYNADPVSIFGGIVALNERVDAATAEEIAKIFVEIVIAPGYEPEALEILCRKKNIRVLELPEIRQKNKREFLDMKKVAGGLLVQELDCELMNEEELKVVTDRAPTAEELAQLKFAWRVVKHTKSNAIVLVKGDQTVGVGPGQTNRITALELAIKYAGDKAAGSVMGSDAFFPFDDCVEAAHQAGITAIIQPGGSIRDEDSIKKCNEYGIAMVFTGMRHFKH